jgi:hypothetical protein
MPRLTRQAWNIAAALWGAAEAMLFFIVPDVLLSFIGLKRGVRAAALASLLAALGAGAGGAAMYFWSAQDPDAARAAVLAVPAVSEAMAARAESAMAENWILATVLGPLSTTPYKLYAVLAPHMDVSAAAFAAAAIPARLPRFLIVSIGVALIGRWLEPRLGARRLAWVLAAAWLAFYALFFALTPN